MKKILLALMMMVSFAFSAWTPYSSVTTGQTIFYLNHYCLIGSPTISGPSYVSYANKPSSCDNWFISDAYQVQNVQCTDTGSSYKVMTYTYPMTWVNSCPTGQTLNASGVCVVPPTPTCTTGSHYDSDVKTCLGDFTQDKVTLENGNFIVSFSDGATTFCDVSTEKCITYDKNGNIIANRFLNPEFNTDGSIKYAGITPNAIEISSWASSAYDVYGKPLVNAFGNVLQAFGIGLAYTSTGGGYLVSDTSGLNFLNPFATIGAGIFALGSALVTDDNIITTSPTSENVSIKISENSGASFASLDSVASATPETGTPVFSPNGVYTYRQITEANLKTVWDNAAGVGKMPPTALVLGSDIIFPTNNPNTAIVNSPTQIEVVKTSPDNSAQSIVINKADLANTASSGTDLPYTVKNYASPVINNDGTVTQSTTTTASSTSASTNATTSTNSSTGQTTTTLASNGTTTATSSDGTSINLSGVTSRLDSLGNQLTKANTTLDDIEKLTKEGEVTATTHGIPTDTSGGDWNSYSQAWENIKSSFNEVNSKATEVQGLFQNGFQVNLVGGSVSTCAYTATVDFGYFNIPFEFDPCITASQYRNVFYTFFYLLFVIGILSFSVKSFLRLA